MNPPVSPSAAKRADGFTLIELLVVISVIGILAGLLLPMFGIMQNRSRKVQAINDMRNIRTATTAYYTDYRKYPINDKQASAAAVDYDTIYGDPGGLYSSANLFNILRAIEKDDEYNKENALNPNKTVYWDGQMVKDRKNPRSGITYDDFKDGENTVKAGSFVDPWGNPYIGWVDATNDGDLSKAAHWFYLDISEDKGTIHTGLPPMGMEFSSLGPDGEWGTKENYKMQGSDDIVTWQ